MKTKAGTSVQKREPKRNVAVLVSGSGTTVESFIKDFVAGKTETSVGLVITSNPKAGAIDKVDALNATYGLGIETKHIGRQTHPDSAEEEQALIDILSQKEYDAIVLMGYMRKVGPKLVDSFGWRINYTSPYQAKMLNTHPGLLPATKGTYGVHVQERALSQQHTRAGQTLHIVSEEYDEGPTIKENYVEILPEDSPETLFARVQAKEKACIAHDVEQFIIERKKYLEGTL